MLPYFHSDGGEKLANFCPDLTTRLESNKNETNYKMLYDFIRELNTTNQKKK